MISADTSMLLILLSRTLPCAALKGSVASSEVRELITIFSVRTEWVVTLLDRVPEVLVIFTSLSVRPTTESSK